MNRKLRNVRFANFSHFSAFQLFLFDAFTGSIFEIISFLPRRFGRIHPIHRSHHNNSECDASSHTICALNEYAPMIVAFAVSFLIPPREFWCAFASIAPNRAQTQHVLHTNISGFCVCRLWYINLFISNLINFIVAVCAALAVYKLHGCTSCGCDFHTYVLIRKYAYFAY